MKLSTAHQRTRDQFGRHVREPMSDGEAAIIRNHQER